MAKEKETEEKTETKKETKPSYELVQIATNTANVIRDNSTDSVISNEQALVQVLNELKEIKRLLG